MTRTVEFNKQKLIMARFGEIALKGLNRHKFEERLLHNLALKLKQYGSYQVTLSQSRIWIIPNVTPTVTETEIDLLLQKAIEVATETFGIVSVSPVYLFAGDYSNILQISRQLVEEHLERGDKTFKVDCRRAEKSFPLTSMEIMNQLGGDLLEAYPELKVDIHQPDFIIKVEIRQNLAVYSQVIQGVRGLPTGMSAKGLVLLSGGIDSPVAAYMMASRGMELEAIYFHTSRILLI